MSVFVVHVQWLSLYIINNSFFLKKWWIKVEINSHPQSGKQSKWLSITQYPWRYEVNLVKWIVLTIYTYTLFLKIEKKNHWEFYRWKTTSKKGLVIITQIKEWKRGQKLDSSPFYPAQMYLPLSFVNNSYSVNRRNFKTIQTLKLQQ